MGNDLPALMADARQVIDKRSTWLIVLRMKFLPDYRDCVLSDFGILISDEALAASVGDLYKLLYGDHPVRMLIFMPMLAAQFCERFRKEHGYWDLPDAVILESLEAWEKAGRP